MRQSRTRLETLPPRVLATASAGIALGAMLSCIPGLPSPIRGILLGAFVLAGPGSTLLSLFPTLPSYAVFALIPASSFSICLIVVSVLLNVGYYEPRPVLLALATATLVAALIRRVALTRSIGDAT